MSTYENTLRAAAPIIEHYRCPEEVPDFEVDGILDGPSGYFRFGKGAICYGQTLGNPGSTIDGPLFDASVQLRSERSRIFLPFDVTQVVDNLRYERYVNQRCQRRWVEQSLVRDIYYWLRPMLPVFFRKHLQRAYLRGWDNISFPAWPVDRSVDTLFEKLLVLALQTLQADRLPFIWFWPEGHRACVIVTHDVETAAGRDYCRHLMDIDDSFGVKASFQIVPEKRYAVSRGYLESIRERGFEINVHGLNHDGTLFRNREEFVRCAMKINQYAEEYGARGFRSPILHRNLDWFTHLKFDYDMSVPNVARLDPQRGGCCTVMPYFLPGGMTELPVTTTQDYTLFHILHEHSFDLWRQQINTILDGHGLMSFLIHPDYIMQLRAQSVYKVLLEEINRLRSDHRVWVTLPRDVDRWWRDRSEMKLVAHGQDWKIEGPGNDRARVAYARLEKGHLVYEIDASRAPETF
jgi:hypothetical protein